MSHDRARRITTTIPLEIRKYLTDNGVRVSFLIQKGYESVTKGSETIIKQLAADLKYQEELRAKWQMLHKEVTDELNFVKQKYAEQSLELEKFKSTLPTIEPATKEGANE